MLRQGFSRLGSAAGIVTATALLFAMSPLLAGNVLSHSSLMSMLPFAAILALAAAGQTLVVQQGGIDLSVAGTVSMAAAIVTTYPAGDDGKLVVAVLLVVLATLLSGLVVGFTVTVVGLSPIVATLGMNALLLGVNVRITGGSSTTAPRNLTDLALGKTFGLPNTTVAAAVVIGVTFLLVKRTVPGRRFEAVGAGPAVARAAGLSTRRYTISAYVAASLFYGMAGVMLAGFVRIPAVNAGNEYLLPSIAAVVIGGTSLLGGAGNLAASGLGALFLTQLDQVTRAMGADTATQTVIQALIIALGMIVQVVPRWRRTRPSSPGSLSTGAAGAGEPGRSATDPNVHTQEGKCPSEETTAGTGR